MEIIQLGARLPDVSAGPVPPVIAGSGDRAARRALEWFAARLENRNTRQAYGKAVGKFCLWCEAKGLRRLEDVQPVHVAGFLNDLATAGASRATRRQHLSAVRGLFTDLLSGGTLGIEYNPALAVRGPRMVIERGKTPILTAAEARRLIETPDATAMVGLRDRTILETMLYTFARVSAVGKLDVTDYRKTEKGAELLFREKAGRRRVVPVHPELRRSLDTYLERTGIETGPLFRTARGRGGTLSDRRMARADIYRMVRRRAKQAGLRTQGVSAHSLRGTGITQFRRQGGSLEVARQIAGHKRLSTTRLYDHSDTEIEAAEIERISF